MLDQQTMPQATPLEPGGLILRVELLRGLPPPYHMLLPGVSGANCSRADSQARRAIPLPPRGRKSPCERQTFIRLAGSNVRMCRKGVLAPQRSIEQLGDGESSSVSATRHSWSDWREGRIRFGNCAACLCEPQAGCECARRCGRPHGYCEAPWPQPEGPEYRGGRPR